MLGIVHPEHRAPHDQADGVVVERGRERTGILEDALAIVEAEHGVLLRGVDAGDFGTAQHEVALPHRVSAPLLEKDVPVGVADVTADEIREGRKGIFCGLGFDRACHASSLPFRRSPRSSLSRRQT